MSEKPSVTLVGAGSMGGALLCGWLNDKIIDCSKSAIFDPKIDDALLEQCIAEKLAVNPEIKTVETDYLVLATKPQVSQEVLPRFASLAHQSITISVMAGRSIAAISSAFGDGANDPSQIVRGMPNLPAAFGAGVTGIYAPASIEVAKHQDIGNLLSAVGPIVWVESEEAIDWVTAISGSGPAYYFQFTEALMTAAISLGLSEKAARKLARATLTGAGEMARQDERAIDEMRMAVTSPGGTTAAALNVYQNENKLQNLVHEAVFAAAKRAGELSR